MLKRKTIKKGRQKLKGTKDTQEETKSERNEQMKKGEMVGRKQKEERRVRKPFVTAL
jgi:hypothetical protein